MTISVKKHKKNTVIKQGFFTEDFLHTHTHTHTQRERERERERERGKEEGERDREGGREEGKAGVIQTERDVKVRLRPT